MTGLVVPVVFLVVAFVTVEFVRWNLRPEQKRLRRLRKIGGRR